MSVFHHKAYIGLGSNLGDSLEIIQASWKLLDQCSGVACRQISSPYRTKPVGMRTDNWFINAVGLVMTSLSPLELLAQLLALEKRFGRKRPQDVQGYQDRFLDLDLLLYDALVVQTPVLILPHPRMTQRLFVLKPLAEICSPDTFIPASSFTVHRHLHLCEQSDPDYSIRPLAWRGNGC